VNINFRIKKQNEKLLTILVFCSFRKYCIICTDQDQDQDQKQDRLMLVDGDVLQIRDRDQIRLQDKIILTDGTTVNRWYLQKKDVCVCVMENA
jgi:hypothetical protein